MSQPHTTKITDHQQGVARSSAKPSSPKAKTESKVKDALDEIRVAAQDLHRALTDAAAKRGGALKSDLEALPQKAKALMDSMKTEMSAESEATKKLLTQAISFLEAMHKQVTASLKSDGHAFEASVRQAIADARASVQHISEAIAGKRSAKSATKSK